MNVWLWIFQAFPDGTLLQIILQASDCYRWSCLIWQGLNSALQQCNRYEAISLSRPSIAKCSPEITCYVPCDCLMFLKRLLQHQNTLSSGETRTHWIMFIKLSSSLILLSFLPCIPCQLAASQISTQLPMHPHFTCYQRPKQLPRSQVMQSVCSSTPRSSGWCWYMNPYKTGSWKWGFLCR